MILRGERQRLRWDAQLNNLLRERYPLSSKEELLSLFPGQSWPSLVHRASRLGISRDALVSHKGMMPDETMVGHLSERDKAYLAGIVDGEGTISLQRSQPERSRSWSYRLQISVTTVSPALYRWLEANTPHIPLHAKKPTPTGRTLYQWRISGTRKCLVFLREIRPYLVIKAEQADHMIEGYVHLTESGRDGLYHTLRTAKKLP